ncbi:DUF309 domain-containing protein [Bacillus sp. KH172YL63]|uniref:DUF309 domain-containing protein n=1 Tax=Bacillus sp. KH172YL63 TaxID=2709784 RepID=UPI0013E41E5B|nr:DUF309 domain-containing protein [Bacillus sp. KH172YL63]BCB04591.1 hypothetical protein KH172YL63_27240 [Bacillus sp. KH172YL63]
MAYPQAYLAFLMYFHGNRDYFECHEVLEEYWKEVDPKNRSSHWVGLIQVAVGFYHYRRKNTHGAVRTFIKAIRNIEMNEGELTKLGLDTEMLKSMLVEVTEDIHENKPYHSINLPLTQADLINKVEALCHSHGFTWCAPSDLSIAEIVHRHSLRDRSDVIAERNEALRKKRG